MNAVYWGLTALCIMKRKEALDAEEMIEYVMSCWDDNAGTSVTPMSLPTNSNSLPTCQHSTPPLPQRCLRRTPRTRRAHPLHAKRHPNPSDARRPLAHRLATHNRLYALLIPPFPQPPSLTHQTEKKKKKITSHSGSATALGRLRRRRLRRDRHALPLLRRLGPIPPRRARQTRSRADRILPRILPQL